MTVVLWIVCICCFIAGVYLIAAVYLDWPRFGVGVRSRRSGRAFVVERLGVGDWPSTDGEK